MKRVKGKWALITGASSGIGKHISVELARSGCNLVLVSRSEDKLIQLKKSLSDNGDIKVAVFPQDLSKPDAPENVVKNAQEPMVTMASPPGIQPKAAR